MYNLIYINIKLIIYILQNIYNQYYDQNNFVLLILFNQSKNNQYMSLHLKVNLLWQLNLSTLFT